MRAEKGFCGTNSCCRSRVLPFGFGQKMELVSPFQGLFRPYVGLPCQSCSPKSMENFYYKRHTRLGFRNIIHITEEDTRYRGWLVRRLCGLVFIWECSTDQDFTSKVSEKICQHPSVQLIINETNDVTCSNDSSCKNGEIKVLKVLGQIQKALSPFLIRLVHWMLVKLLQRLYLNLQLHSGQVATLREVSNACPGVPVVYLSTHPSWLDGLLVSFILNSQKLKVPRVAWDREDCPRLLRYFLQKLGTVFIPPDGPNAHLKDAVFSVYIETLLADGLSLLVFLETLSPPCCHTLSPVANKWVSAMMTAIQSGAVADILIVPVGISYDSHLEFVSPGRTVASVLGALHLIMYVLCPWTVSLGCARVDFAQPFSLQEYITNYTWKHLAPVPRLQEALLPYILGQRKKMYDEMALGGEMGTPGVQKEALVNGFMMHSLRAAVSCSAVMCSSMISALLLHRHRNGVLLSKILSEFSLMTEDILLHGFDLGFSGQRWDLIRHSLYTLRTCVTLFSGPSNSVYVLCRESRNSVLELGQRSASLLPVFLYEAIGACALHALMAQLPSLCLVEILFTREELIEMMFCLGSLLPRNILLQPPCQSLYVLCQDIMDKLIQCGLLTMYEDPSVPPACDTGRRNFADRLMWRSNDDMSDSDSDLMEENVKRHYKLERSERHADSFVFLCHLLGPVLKTYERAAQFLQEPDPSESETKLDYVDRLHQYLLLKAEEDGSYECTERSLADCVVETFTDLGLVFLCLMTCKQCCIHNSCVCMAFQVLECSPGGHRSTTHLSETFLQKENCNRLLSFIQQFIYKG
ncbi:glycerol-3-phosphate acyltransferase 2, mitochondrial [Gastrophryne carolinensis]